MPIMEKRKGQIVYKDKIIYPETLDTQITVEDSKNIFKSEEKTLNNILEEILNKSDNSKVDKIIGKQLTDENYSLIEKTKLAEIESGANKYIHPTNHQADIITQDDSHRFVTKQQIQVWNSLSSSKDIQLLLDDIKKENAENIQSAINNLILNSPNNLNTLGKLATAINCDPEYDKNIKLFIKDKMNTLTNATCVASFDITDLSKINDILDIKPGDLINLVSYEYEFFDLKNKEGKTFNEAFTKSANQKQDISKCYKIEDKDIFNSAFKDNPNSKVGDIFYTTKTNFLKTYICINTNPDITDFDKRFRLINENDYIDKKISAIIDSAPESLNTLKEISKSLNNDANFASTMTKQLASKVDKVEGKQLTEQNYSLAEKTKLGKIENEANKYTHPTTHSSDMIVDNANKRFTNDSEKNKWNNTTTDVNALKQTMYNNSLKHLETDNRFSNLAACKNGFVDNLMLKGKTVQNLIQSKNNFPMIEVNTTKSSMEYMLTSTGEFMMDENKTYTLISTINMKSASENWSVNLKYYDNNGNAQYLTIHDSAKGNSISNIKKVIKFENMKNIELIGIASSGKGGNYNFIWENLMILEGDWTEKEIPYYFYGIKSVGEIEGNKISLKTYNKNIFNGILPIEIKAKKAGNSEIIDVNVKSPTGITIVAIDSNGQLINTNTIAIRFWDNSNTSCNFGCFLNKTYLNHIKQFSKIQIFWNDLNNADITISRIIIGLGDCSNEILNYGENYKDSTSILLNEPLYGIDDENFDVLNYTKEERIKNIGKKVFSGAASEAWNPLTTNAANTIFMQIALPGMKSNSNKICSMFKNYSGNFLWNNDIEGIADNGNGMFHLRINKTRLSSPDFNGAIAWLKANPLTLYYPLTIPIKENIDIKDTLQTFEDGYLESTNSINPSIELDYAINVISVISRNVKEIDGLIDRVNKPLTWNDLRGM